MQGVRGARKAAALCAVTAAGALVALAAAAWGAPVPVGAADLVGAYNPLGLKLRVEQAAHWGPSEPGARYLEVDGILAVSPAYVQGALGVEGAPLPFLVLRAQADLYGFFGSSGSLLSFPSKDADFGPDALEDRRGDERTGNGRRLLFQPTLRARFGPVLVRNQTDLAEYRFDGRGPYFYEQEYDTLLRDGDLLVANRTQALLDWSRAAGPGTLFAGPFYEIVRARASGITRQRWGLLGYWEGAQGGLVGGKPRVFLLTGVNTEDRNRQGELFLVLGAGWTFSR